LVHWDQSAHAVLARAILFRSEVEQRGQRASVRQAARGVAKLVVEGVGTSFKRLDTLLRRVPKHFGDQIHGLRRCARAEHLAPRMGLDLGELELGVVLVHALNFFPGRSANNFDNFNELVDVGFAGEERLPKDHLGQNTTERPRVNVGRVVGGAKDQLRGSIVPRANVGNVRFPSHQGLCAAEVAKLHDMRHWVQEEVLRLDVAVTNTQLMDVSKRTS